MFLLGYYDDGTPVMGLPGCVMYAGATIFDLVLPWVAADVSVTKEWIVSLGAVSYTHLLAVEAPEGDLSPVSHDFCADCRRIRVTADGKLKGCLHSREEIPLRGLHGQALEDAVRRGILHKPERHRCV